MVVRSCPKRFRLVIPAFLGALLLTVPCLGARAFTGGDTLALPGGGIVPAGVIANWDFDEGEGDTLHDRSGNGHHGHLHGAKWVEGLRGKALEFDGQDMVEVPGDSALNVKSFTFSIWLKQSGNGFRVPLWEFQEPHTPVGVCLWANTSGWAVDAPGAFFANLRPHDASGSQPSEVRERNLLYTGAGAAQGGRWNHVVVALDHPSLKSSIYVNGKLRAVRTLQPFLPRTVGSLLFGRRSPLSVDWDAGMGLVGALDQAHLFGRALSETEVLALYGQPQVDPKSIHLGMKTHHAKAGDTLWVPVYISSEGKDSLAALEFKLGLDTTVAALLDVQVDTALAVDWEVTDWNRAAKSPVAIALAGTRRLVGPQEGELLRLKIKVLPGLRQGASTQLSLIDVLADEGRLTAVSVAPGRIFVIPLDTLYGDVTGNGAVELSDAQTILRHVVGELSLPDSEFPDFTVAIADVSGNGKITSYDAALVLHYALGIIEDFPVERHGLAKRASSPAQLGISTPVRLDGDTWRYRIQGTNLEGLISGELRLDILDPAAEISGVASGLAGVRVTYRRPAGASHLEVALAANRRVVAGAVPFLEVETRHTPGSIQPVLALRSAWLNDGALAVEGLQAHPLGVEPDARKRAAISGTLRMEQAGGHIRLSVAGQRLREVEVFGSRGERLFAQRLPAPAPSLQLMRSKLPAGILFLRVRGESGRWHGTLPPRQP